MATNLVRFEAGDGPTWGVVTGGEIAPLIGQYPTTAALIERALGSTLLGSQHVIAN